MTSGNSSKTQSIPDGGDAAGGALPSRLETAEQVPFVLRAWWLREFKEYRDIGWCGEPSITGPLWSNYSDPLCDMGSLDYGP